MNIFILFFPKKIAATGKSCLFQTPYLSMCALLCLICHSLKDFVTEGTVLLFHKMQIMSPCLMSFNVAEQPKVNLIAFCLSLLNCSLNSFLIYRKSLYIFYNFIYNTLPVITILICFDIVYIFLKNLFCSLYFSFSSQ